MSIIYNSIPQKLALTFYLIIRNEYLHFYFPSKFGWTWNQVESFNLTSHSVIIVAINLASNQKPPTNEVGNN